MYSKFLLALGFCFSVAQVSSAAPDQSCPDLSGTYTCTDSLGQAPWTYIGHQSVNENGHTIFNGIVADGVTYHGGDPDSGTSYVYRNYCQSSIFVMEEHGTYLNGDGIPTDYNVGSINYRDPSGNYISEILVDGTIERVITCVKQVKP